MSRQYKSSLLITSPNGIMEDSDKNNSTVLGTHFRSKKELIYHLNVALKNSNFTTAHRFLRTNDDITF